MKFSLVILLLVVYYAQAQAPQSDQEDIQLNRKVDKKNREKRRLQSFQCEQSYEKASDYYEKGQFERAIQTVLACAPLTLPAVTKVNILRLLTRSYLYLDRFEDATTYIRALLRFEPEYTLRVDDPIEFRKLYEKYRTFPAWSLTFFLSPNISFIRPTRTYNIDNDDNKTRYSPVLNPFSVGLGYYRWFSRAHMSVNFSLYYTQRAFSAEKELFSFSKSSSFSTLTFTSAYQTIGAPLTFNYNFKSRSKASLTAGVGGEAFYIFASNMLDVNRSNSVLNPRNFDNISQRRQISYNAVAQIGVNYKVKRAYLQVILRYAYNFHNTVLENQRYTTAPNLQDLLYTYGHLDDDFLIDQIQISFRYTRLFYNPKLHRPQK